MHTIPSNVRPVPPDQAWDVFLAWVATLGPRDRTLVLVDYKPPVPAGWTPLRP